MTAPLLRSLYLLLLSLACSHPTWAGGASLEQQRDIYRQARSALQAADYDRSEALKQQLRDYPLLPYLEYRQLLQTLNQATDAQVSRFLTTYADTPLAPRLRGVWLRHLAKTRQWQTFLQFDQDQPGRVLLCHRITALLKTGQQQRALEMVEPIWLSATSQPDACDPALDAWKQAGRLTPALAWQRVALAMKANETGLARYLARFLDPQQKALLAKWQQLHRTPEKIEQIDLGQADAKELSEIILHEFRRLVRRDHALANSSWPRLNQRYAFDANQRYRAERALLLQNIRDGGSELLVAFDRFTPEADDLHLQETRIRAALLQQDWGRVFSWIGLLPKKQQQAERWRYWRAVALSHIGNPERSGEELSLLARERSYHGFLAADRLGLEYKFDQVPLQPDPAALRQIEAIPAIARARELFILQEYTDARREWRHATSPLEPAQLKLAAKLAQTWGWHDRAIFTLAKTGYWDDLELRFPIEHQQLVGQGARTNSLEVPWILALIRQESAFSVDAQSPVGARGLMQLMPQTARFIARQTQHKRPAVAQLKQPRININLGTAYLGRVYREFGKHQALATAAYNAGPHRVRSWLPDTPVAADIWVESIPFSETRRYTERVLSYLAIYQQRLGQRYDRVSSRLTPIKPETQLSGDPVSGDNETL